MVVNWPQIREGLNGMFSFRDMKSSSVVEVYNDGR